MPSYAETSTYGDSSLRAWTSYTPTVTAGSGTFTTVSATGKYCKIGKTVFWRVHVTITTIGTAAGGVYVTLPVTAQTATDSAFYGREDAITGNSLNGRFVNSTTATILQYNNSSPIVAGYQLKFGGAYEAA